jgi:hypothetical protein
MMGESNDLEEFKSLLANEDLESSSKNIESSNRIPQREDIGF